HQTRQHFQMEPVESAHRDGRKARRGAALADLRENLVLGLEHALGPARQLGRTLTESFVLGGGGHKHRVERMLDRESTLDRFRLRRVPNAAVSNSSFCAPAILLLRSGAPLRFQTLLLRAPRRTSLVPRRRPVGTARELFPHAVQRGGEVLRARALILPFRDDARGTVNEANGGL